MSDTVSSTAAGTSLIPQFTEREVQLLSWAMHSLKSGPPEIDNEKLAALVGMINSRSAGNAWGKLKKKLMSVDEAPATPTKAAPTPAKKKAAKYGETPKKATHRKRPGKKQEFEDSDASPKKKGRAAKTKKDDEAVDAKAESDDSEANSDDIAVKP